MTQPRKSVRGTAARDRAGATDTTMLIWKIIDANPGIDREGIWERAEHGIPEGYALRLFKSRRKGLVVSSDSATTMAARRRLLTQILWEMHGRAGLVHAEGPPLHRRYTTIRPPRYYGDASTIDETGTRAAEHMARADALRILRAARARVNPAVSRGPNLTIRRGKEMEAFDLLLDALSNTPSAS